MSEEKEKDKSHGYYIQAKNILQEYVMHMPVAPGKETDLQIVFYPYVSKDEIATTIKPFPIDICYQSIEICIERRTRSIAFMLKNEEDHRTVLFLGEKELSSLLLDLQQLLKELRKIPISRMERFP